MFFYVVFDECGVRNFYRNVSILDGFKLVFLVELFCKYIYLLYFFLRFCDRVLFLFKSKIFKRKFMLIYVNFKFF